jgi:hypothetical protein
VTSISRTTKTVHGTCLIVIVCKGRSSARQRSALTAAAGRQRVRRYVTPATHMTYACSAAWKSLMMALHCLLRKLALCMRASNYAVHHHWPLSTLHKPAALYSTKLHSIPPSLSLLHQSIFTQTSSIIWVPCHIIPPHHMLTATVRETVRAADTLPSKRARAMDGHSMFLHETYPSGACTPPLANHLSQLTAHAAHIHAYLHVYLRAVLHSSPS